MILFINEIINGLTLALVRFLFMNYLLFEKIKK